jgi:hypothetical protein
MSLSCTTLTLDAVFGRKDKERQSNFERLAQPKQKRVEITIITVPAKQFPSTLTSLEARVAGRQPHLACCRNAVTSLERPVG